MDNDVKTALRSIGIVAIGFLAILLTGLYLPGFMLLIIPPVVLGITGLVLTDNKTAALVWAGIGLVAGALFWIAA